MQKIPKIQYHLISQRTLFNALLSNRATSTKVRVGGPDGGDGGRGGDVLFQADPRVKSLVGVLGHYRARDGAHGHGSYNQGSDGKCVVVKVSMY